MARDRKRSKQRQQRRARAHRDDARTTAQRAFGRSAEDDAAELNGADRERTSEPASEPAAEPGSEPAAEAVTDSLPESALELPPEAETEIGLEHVDGPHAAEHELDTAAADPELLAAEPEIIGDPTLDPRFAAATQPDFNQPVRSPFEESDYDDEDEPSSGGAVAAVRAPRAPARPAQGNRVTGFLRASWAELQRVQWPNRQQVFQATAVVLGFVVVAGAFLALADFVAGKVIDAIL